MYHIRSDFRPGTKAFAIPLSWFRSVAEFINSLCSGTGIRMTNPAHPGPESPVRISVDEAWLKQKVAEFAPQQTGGGDGAQPTPDADNINNAQTGDGGIEGIASATDTTAYVDGDDVSDTAARIAPLGAGEGSWKAGGAQGLKQYEISRIVPFTYGSGSLPERYAKIFVRLVTRNHNGQVVSMGDEVDQGLVIQLH